ncbi:transcriptional regulator [Desulfosporosinus acidiphilus SJ4]|uniref:Transcriptional regulator n=1 Tax=Desulfosporosinus acidiphilus (strain DSM 22704 / JCM 16185 / SJ4) TaxID=646529 RepID=I4D2N3_DESAJ|nr:MarR family winged helix-turn-helix transcriptional regulator [Desulfosporosinus acidiphilus]AFM40057.1 transcriptional regulator [Desulfosporosinus acidiphilus SJ4]
MDYSNKNVKLAAEVVQSFMTISKTLVRFTQQNASSLGLTVQQMGIINTIYSTPSATLKAITEKLQMSKSTVSVNVDELVKAELIERKISEEDRREINLTLTAKGVTLAQKSCQNASSYKAMMSALEDISEEKIQELMKTHNELLANLRRCNLPV